MRDLVECLQERGLIQEMTPGLSEHLRKARKLYVGFDPTAPSLHLGNLIGIIALEWALRLGHTPVVILGGATARIGDPSGKSIERPLLSEEALDYNKGSLRTFFSDLFRGQNFLLFDNSEWLNAFSLISFLRDVGKKFRLGPMLAKESVKVRLHSEEGISFTEFTYQILQGYDFAHLHREEGVTVQMGGSDQWGNITAGIELNRKEGLESVFGLAWPLLTRSDGKKFGKSEGGAIWLSSHYLSPYEFYQYFLTIPDKDVVSMLKIFTFLALKEIEELAEREREPNGLQRRLAAEVTRYIHGEEGLAKALLATEGLKPGSKEVLSGDALRELQKEVPGRAVALAEVVGKRFVDLAVEVGFLESKGEATRLIQGGGAYINQERVTDPKRIISADDLIDDAFLLLSQGKKRRFLLSIDINSLEK